MQSSEAMYRAANPQKCAAGTEVSIKRKWIIKGTKIQTAAENLKMVIAAINEN